MTGLNIDESHTQNLESWHLKDIRFSQDEESKCTLICHCIGRSFLVELVGNDQMFVQVAQEILQHLGLTYEELILQKLDKIQELLGQKE